MASLHVKRLTDTAKLPVRKTEHSVGYDLYADSPYGYDIVVSPHKSTVVPLGIAVAIPNGYYGRIAPRSGLALRGIDVGGGVIDPDYRGEVKVILYNHGDVNYTISRSDRIAQLIIECVATPNVVEVTGLTGTERGEKGFGSTGGFASSKE